MDNCPRVPRKFSRLLGAKKHALSRKNGDAIRFSICRLRAGSCTAFCKRLLVTVAVLEFPAVGYRDNNSTGTLNNAGTNGNYWSSVQNNTNEAYRMNFNSSGMNTNNNDKRNGFSVRCVRQRIYDPVFNICKRLRPSFFEIQAVQYMFSVSCRFCKRLLA